MSAELDVRFREGVQQLREAFGRKAGLLQGELVVSQQHIDNANAQVVQLEKQLRAERAARAQAEAAVARSEDGRQQLLSEREQLMQEVAHLRSVLDQLSAFRHAVSTLVETESTASSIISSSGAAAATASVAAQQHQQQQHVQHVPHAQPRVRSPTAAVSAAASGVRFGGAVSTRAGSTEAAGAGMALSSLSAMIDATQHEINTGDW